MDKCKLWRVFGVRFTDPHVTIILFQMEKKATSADEMAEANKGTTVARFLP